MIGAFVSLLLIAGAALVVGAALMALAAGAGRYRPAELSPLAAPVGLAAVLVLAGIAIRLRAGH